PRPSFLHDALPIYQGKTAGILIPQTGRFGAPLRFSLAPYLTAALSRLIRAGPRHALIRFAFLYRSLRTDTQRPPAFRLADRRPRLLPGCPRRWRSLAAAHGGSRSAKGNARSAGGHRRKPATLRLRMGWRNAAPERPT